MGGERAGVHRTGCILGLFIALIVTNCVIIGRAEAFAARHSVGRAAVDGLAMGLGFTTVLVLLGGLRELVGQGTLFSQAHLLFGEAARGMTLHLIPNYRGFLLAILPPGAFLGLGLLIALKKRGIHLSAEATTSCGRARDFGRNRNRAGDGA